MIQQLALGDSQLVLVPGGALLKELTEIAERNAVLWIRGEERVLFAEGLSDHDKLWGEKVDAAERAKALGLQLRSPNDFETELSSRGLSLSEILLPFSDHEFLSRIVAKLSGAKRFHRQEASLRDLRPHWGSLKLIKSQFEIAALREAGRRSAEVHVELMKQSWVGKTEKDMARFFEIELRKREIDQCAYESIVASGERSLILHGRASEKKMQAGELVLIDAAGMWKGLCADITRTWAISGRFTEAQKRLYEVVLNAQKRAIQSVRPGTTLGKIHKVAKSELREGLMKEGWLSETQSELFDSWYPHNTSHWLGRHVHDLCPYFEKDGSEIVLEAGMVLTIEPGLYLRGDEAAAEVRNFGIRIEDDVLVTASGCEILTSAVPKEVSEIEMLGLRPVQNR